MRRLVLTATAVVVLAAGCGPSNPSRNAAAFLDVMPELKSFVEKTRGLTFKEPVPVELLSPSDFRARLNDGGSVDDLWTAQGVDDDLAFFRAFGLVQGPIDVSKVAKALDRGTDGFYEPWTKRLFIQIAEPTPYNQMVVVHELTHALDDQYFDLDRDFDDDEEEAAFDALVEGNATAVERFYQSRSPADRARIDREADRLADRTDTVPKAFVDDAMFPYRAGLTFADALYAKGGGTAVNAAYRRPPETTEQILHLDRYDANEAPVVVKRPQADGDLSWSGTLGESWFRLLLTGALDAAGAERAAAGWGGDRYVVWETGSRLCARTALVMDTPEDVAEMVAGLRAWAARLPGATVAGTNPILITGCGDRSLNRP